MKRVFLAVALLLLAGEAFGQSYKSKYTGTQIDSAVTQAIAKSKLSIILDSSVVTTSRKFVIWATGADTLVIDSVLAVAMETSDLTLQITYDPDRSQTGTNVFTSAQTVNSSTTGNRFSTFANATINPGRWIWLSTPAITTKPYSFTVEIFYHLK